MNQHSIPYKIITVLSLSPSSLYHSLPPFLPFPFCPFICVPTSSLPPFVCPSLSFPHCLSLSLIFKLVSKCIFSLYFTHFIVDKIFNIHPSAVLKVWRCLAMTLNADIFPRNFLQGYEFCKVLIDCSSFLGSPGSLPLFFGFHFWRKKNPKRGLLAV